MNNFQLTKREYETLKLVTKGYSNQEIAKELFVSIHTVKAHIESIYAKLNVHSKVQAAIFAIFNNMIDIQEVI